MTIRAVLFDFDFTLGDSAEAIVHKAAAALGVPEASAVYVGDHPVDGHAARRAGMRFVRVLTGEDQGPDAWAGIEAAATIDGIGDLPGVLDRI